MTYKCSMNLKKSIDWQRGSADKLIELIKKKEMWYNDNHCKFWNDWVVDVFNLETANEFGLSVWSVILDVPIFGESRRSRSGYPAIYFGDKRKNFGRGNFGKNSSTIEALTVEQKRIILQLKAFAMHSNSSTYEINEKLSELFGYRNVYVLDNLDMTYTYVVNTPEISSFIKTVNEFDLLPRPSCVKTSVVIGSNSAPFLFGKFRNNFGRGNFYIGIK